MVQAYSIPIRVSDVTGQRHVEAREVPVDATIGELIESLLPGMSLPRNDSGGRPMTYHARLDREGRHLHASEVVGDSLLAEDRLVLHPEINAGGLA
ncbi:MAG: hypothetical protein KJ072_20170 [Verrucomicrobia bacterium]|nr:hypothetical protein [Verrucomicrobiota bacterium]